MKKAGLASRNIVKLYYTLLYQLCSSLWTSIPIDYFKAMFEVSGYNTITNMAKLQLTKTWGPLGCLFSFHWDIYIWNLADSYAFLI